MEKALKKKPGPKKGKWAKSGKGKHPGGCPLKFKPEYTAKLIKFFDIEAYTEKVSESTIEYFANGAVKKKSEKKRLVPNKMPTLYQFSRKIGVHYITVLRWAEKGRDKELDEIEATELKKGALSKQALETAQGLKMFSGAYKEAKELQKEFLMSLGLVGAAPSAAYIFTAKNVTDMRDKSEATLIHKRPRPLLDNLRNKSKQQKREEELEEEEEEVVE